MRRGFRARSASAPSPSSSARPGRRLWRNTSASATSRSNASRPRGSRSDSARDRLPAFAERNIVPSPFQNGGPHARPSSPVSGRSTLTTSAPSAARIWAQYGPAIEVVTSRTRIPLSGACMTASSPDAPLRGCTAVFDQFTEWISGAWWSYPLIFAVSMIDAFFPVVPSESVVLTAGNLASSGDLWLLGVIAAAAGGAIVGDNISYAIGKYAGEHTVKRLFRSDKARRGF